MRRSIHPLPICDSVPCGSSSSLPCIKMAKEIVVVEELEVSSTKMCKAWQRVCLGTLTGRIFQVSHNFRSSLLSSFLFFVRRHHEYSRVAWTAFLYGVNQVSLMAQKKEIAYRSPLAVAHRQLISLRWVKPEVLRLLVLSVGSNKLH
jgi:hypothetical protein